MLRMYLLAGLGGFIGTLLRYGVQKIAVSWGSISFPFGTFTVNLVGSLIIGIVYGLTERENLLSPESRIFIATGLCGGFTTFSSFTLDTLTLMRQGQHLYAGAYVFASLLLGIAVTYFGFIITKTI